MPPPATDLRAAPPHSGRLLVLVGPSGSGKTTLAHRLISAAPDRRAFSVSHTTRPRRAAEVDGRDYHFIGRADFTAMIEAGELVEWAEVHGNLYGTSRAAVRGALAAGRMVIFDVDIRGATNLHGAFSQAEPVFVAPPTWAELKRRLRARGTETEATLRRRLRTARAELGAVLRQVERATLPWACLVNADLDCATADLEELLARRSPPMDAVRRELLAELLRDARADPLSAPLPPDAPAA